MQRRIAVEVEFLNEGCIILEIREDRTARALVLIAIDDGAGGRSPSG